MENLVTLTAQDIRALKNADSICFDHLPDGKGRIRAIKRAEDSSTGFEQTHEIAVFSRVLNYGAAYDGDYSAFYMVHSARFNDVALTLVRRMTTGATVALVWTRDNSSPVLTGESYHLVRDELRLVIQGKNSKVADTYLVAESVGKDNSARMVRKWLRSV